MISILCFTLVLTLNCKKSVDYIYTRGFIKFDHFNAFLKFQQNTYRLKAHFMLITMPQVSASYD